MLSSVAEMLACTLCGSPLDIHIAQIYRALESRAARVLQALHPSWEPHDHACPDCVLRANPVSS